MTVELCEAASRRVEPQVVDPDDEVEAPVVDPDDEVEAPVLATDQAPDQRVAQGRAVSLLKTTTCVTTHAFHARVI